MKRKIYMDVETNEDGTKCLPSCELYYHCHGLELALVSPVDDIEKLRANSACIAAEKAADEVKAKLEKLERYESQAMDI